MSESRPFAIEAGSKAGSRRNPCPARALPFQALAAQLVFTINRTAFGRVRRAVFRLTAAGCLGDRGLFRPGRLEVLRSGAADRAGPGLVGFRAITSTPLGSRKA